MQGPLMDRSSLAPFDKAIFGCQINVRRRPGTSRLYHIHRVILYLIYSNFPISKLVCH